MKQFYKFIELLHASLCIVIPFEIHKSKWRYNGKDRGKIRFVSIWHLDVAIETDINDNNTDTTS